MALYYLISQLPSLDGLSENMPLPITEERFCELCRDNLGENQLSDFEKISLAPSKIYEKTGSALIEAWNEGERNLRLALAKIRADKLGKKIDFQNSNLPTEFIKIADSATEMDSPMEAERFLYDFRLKFLEALRPIDSFSCDYIYYFYIKLKLTVRMRGFNRELGEAAYRNIYDSILNGERVEAI